MLSASDSKTTAPSLMFLPTQTYSVASASSASDAQSTSIITTLA